MTTQHPTPDDLRTIAANLQAEGQISRAEVLNNAADQWQRQLDILAEAREVLSFSALVMSANTLLWHLEESPHIPHTGNLENCKNDTCQKLIKLIDNRINPVLAKMDM